MIIQRPPRFPQLLRQFIRSLIIAQYQPQEMPLQPRRFVIDERVSCMHHGQVVEEHHISALQLDLDGMFHGQSMQGVECKTLSRGERREGRRSWSRWRSCDASAGEVDQDSLGGMVGEGDRAGIERLGGRRA